MTRRGVPTAEGFTGLAREHSLEGAGIAGQRQAGGGDRMTIIGKLYSLTKTTSLRAPMLIMARPALAHCLQCGVADVASGSSGSSTMLSVLLLLGQLDESSGLNRHGFDAASF
jgi:hypothetical protein